MWDHAANLPVLLWERQLGPASTSLSQLICWRDFRICVPCWALPLPQTMASLEGCLLEWLLCSSYMVVTFTTDHPDLSSASGVPFHWGEEAEVKVRVPLEGSPRDGNWGLFPKNEGRDPVPSWGVSPDTAWVQRAGNHGADPGSLKRPCHFCL